jgi:hypothetical protein
LSSFSQKTVPVPVKAVSGQTEEISSGSYEGGAPTLVSAMLTELLKGRDHSHEEPGTAEPEGCAAAGQLWV